MDLDKQACVALVGDINSCKTNLGFHFLRAYSGNRKIYLMGYPVKVDDFDLLTNFQDLFSLSNSIVFIDEIHRYIKLHDRKANSELMELISFSGHNNNTIVFTTQLSQFITKGVEAFVSSWCMTRIKDLGSLKNGCKIKRIIQHTTSPKCTIWSLSLNKGEYLEYSDTNKPTDNAIKTFPDEKIGKDWSIDKINKPVQVHPDNLDTETRKVGEKK